MTRLFVVVGAVSAAMTVVVFALAFTGSPSTVIWAVPWVVAYAGGLVAFRSRPHLVAARRLAAFGVLSTTWIGVTMAVVLGFEDVGRRWWLGPGNLAIQLLGLSMWAAMIGLLALYPDGQYRRRHQLVVSRTVAVLAVVVPLGLLVVHPTLHPAWVFFWDAQSPTALRLPEIASPAHVPALSLLSTPMRFYVDSALAVSPVVAAVVGWLRYRSLPAEARLAMRWPLYGVVAVLVAPLAGVLDAIGAVSEATAQLLQVAGVSALPAALAIGLVRPDLFDIDRAMRRSVVYAALWTAIAASYVGGSAALGFAAPGEGVQLAIAATIGASLLFEPGRRHLARKAARWAYGETVTGEELVQRLGAALEHTHDLEKLVATIAAVAREGLGVRWLRVRVDGLEPAIAGEYARGDLAEVVAPLLAGNQSVGEIECGPLIRARGNRRGPDQNLFTAFARQTTLAVQNAQLAAELRLRLEENRETSTELAASRSRLVAAHESARRQIERDIHDGAQQELVALIAGIGLARSQSGGDPGGLAETLTALQAEAGHALENLRQLVAGIHPPVLSDHGLIEAIEMRSSRLPIPVTVECEPTLRLERFSDEVEGAAYFFVSEGLTNALKHAKAGRACIRVARTGRQLEVVVVDDGCGYDVAATPSTGLRGLADRIEAVGGTVDVESAPQQGTTLTMRLPL